MKQLVTRVAYCPKCASKGYPFYGQKFVTYGEAKGYVVHTAKFGFKGYTPHMFEFVGLYRDEVKYHRVCCMERCGATITEKTNNKFNVDFTYGHEERMTLKEWEHLCNFSNTGYKLD